VTQGESVAVLIKRVKGSRSALPDSGKESVDALERVSGGTEFVA